MTEVTTATTPAAPAAKPAKAKKVKPAAKKAAAKARATKVSAAGAKDKAKAKKKDEKNARAISAGRKVKSTETKPKLLEGHELTAKIKYGTGPDKKAYSQANCPKRDGTGAAKQWAKYAKATMTISGAMAAGIPRTFVLHDIRHGYIDVAK